MDDNDNNLNEEEEWIAEWQRIKENDFDTTVLELFGDEHHTQNMTDDEWEELGRDISNNTHLKELHLYDDALNDHKMSFFFRGLTHSNTIDQLNLHGNQLSVAGIRSMVPFLQNAPYLKCLELEDNDLQSEGFNMLVRALRNSPIRRLFCDRCGIESIEIDSEQKPKHLTNLNLDGNNINADGCHGLAKLLHGGDSTLTHLHLVGNKIGDEGVEILVDALRNNISLNWLNLARNHGISKQGQLMLLKLVNNISSIEATMKSNHTLRYLSVGTFDECQCYEIQYYISLVTSINSEEDNLEGTARAKVIQTQLHSGVRTKLAELQGISQSLYSEINPLHLPEVIALVGKNHDQGELYMALKSSIAGVISTVNRKQCLQQQRVYYNAMIAECRTKVREVEAELATIEAAEAEGRTVDMGNESLRTNKRRRK